MMEFSFVRARRLWMVLACLSFVGCSGGGDSFSGDRLQTFPVSGKVTYNGDPVADATVSYQNTSTGPAAVGKTDSSGAYTLQTYEAGDGAPSGSYRISVLKAEVTPGDPSYFDENSPNYGLEPPPEAQSKTNYLIPEKYSRFDTSGLTGEVKQEPNTINLELAD